ncbi:DedA family protein [Spelaeicoccus albus]|nr:DedA family protein [Spelaeicoccus albus]
MDALSNFIMDAANSYWLFPILALCIAFDACFPSFPSETAVVSLSALAASTSSPNIAAIGVSAAFGAFFGDNVAYWLGRSFHPEKWPIMRRPKAQRALERARSGLADRAPLFIITARFVPFVRLAVNITAGATKFRWGRFLPISAGAGIAWAGYSVCVGAIAGSWAQVHPLLSVGVAIAVAIVLGLIINWAVERLFARRAQSQANSRTTAKARSRARSGSPAGIVDRDDAIAADETTTIEAPAHRASDCVKK